MGKITTILFLILITSFSFGQPLVTNDGLTLTSQAGMIVTIQGSLVNQNAGTINNESTSIITLTGDWTNNGGTFIPGNGTVTFIGTGLQNINGTNIGYEPFYNLILDKSGSILTSNNVNIENDVTFSSDGYFEINTLKNVKVQTISKIVGNSNQRFFITNPSAFLRINSVPASSSIFLPIGTSSSNYAPAMITNNDITQYYEASICNDANLSGTCGAGTPIGAVGYTWNIGSLSNNGIVKLYWHSSKSPGMDLTNTSVIHHNGTIWSSISPTVPKYSPAILEPGIGAGYYSRTGTATSFSPFTVQDISKPLPITLIMFNGIIENNVTKIEWITATETNNSYFILEKSKDAINFEKITTIEGAGNSQVVTKYGYNDESPSDGINYYRLTQVDFNGDSQSFPIIAVFYDNENCVLRVFDILGREVNIEQLETGIYIFNNCTKSKLITIIK